MGLLVEGGCGGKTCGGDWPYLINMSAIFRSKGIPFVYVIAPTAVVMVSENGVTVVNKLGV